MKDQDKNLPVRKSVTMPASMWRDIGEFQSAERIVTEAEALRRVVVAGLRLAGKKERMS